jgi:hypothetical protein
MFFGTRHSVRHAHKRKKYNVLGYSCAYMSQPNKQLKFYDPMKFVLSSVYN